MLGFLRVVVYKLGDVIQILADGFKLFHNQQLLEVVHREMQQYANKGTGKKEEHHKLVNKMETMEDLKCF